MNVPLHIRLYRHCTLVALLSMFCLSGITWAAISPVVLETGQLSLSIDGLGTIGVTGTLQVEKPPGATVHSAYLSAASTGFTSRTLLNGDVKLNGSDVIWTSNTASNISSRNHFADVTNLVKAAIDAAPAGLVNINVTEVNSGGIDGEVLAVIFNDPNQTTTNTISLLFGAQLVAGDTFSITLAQPINKADPSLALNMSLGISFGFQANGTQQFSLVNVNGQRLTTSAGGQDDAGSLSDGNGALLTAGGIGDSIANPSNPNGPPANPRSDDELYSLLPLVNTGDTTITVFTQNPSNDDNIFFAAFFLRSTNAVVGEGILLSPTSSSGSVGTSHTLTAKVVNATGQPIVNRSVRFEITTGPNAGSIVNATTNANGEATFTYLGSGAGTDEIVASFVSSQGTTVSSNTATRQWTSTGDNVPPQTTCTAQIVASGRILTLGVNDNIDPNPSIFLRDSVSGFIAGPFARGERVHVRVVPGGTPSQTRLTSNPLAARAQFQGAPLIYATDASGNSSTPIPCP